MVGQDGTPGGGQDDWTTPVGWGGPAQPAPGPPQYGQQHYGQSQYGQPPQQYGQPQYGSWGPLPPALKPGVVPLRPLGLGEVLDGSVGVLRRYPGPALGLAAIVAVVTVLVQTLVDTTLLRPFLELDPAALADGGPQAFQDALGGAFTGAAVAVLLGLLSGAVMAGVLTAVVGKAVLGQPLTLAEAWSSVRPVLLKLIWLSLLSGLIVFGVFLVGTLLAAVLFQLGVPGAVLGVLAGLAAVGAAVWAYVRISLAPCALVLERTGVTASLRRSAVLVRGDWWRVFAILLLILVIAVFVSLTLQAPFEFLGAGSLGGVFDPQRDVLGARALILSGVGSIITTTLVSPFTAGATALLYVDRRMRAEGLDVALAAAAAGAARP